MRYLLMIAGGVTIFGSHVLAANSFHWAGVCLALAVGISGGVTLGAGFRK